MSNTITLKTLKECFLKVTGSSSPTISMSTWVPLQVSQDAIAAAISLGESGGTWAPKGNVVFNPKPRWGVASNHVFWAFGITAPAVKHAMRSGGKAFSAKLTDNMSTLGVENDTVAIILQSFFDTGRPPKVLWDDWFDYKSDSNMMFTLYGSNALLSCIFFDQVVRQSTLLSDQLCKQIIEYNGKTPRIHRDDLVAVNDQHMVAELTSSVYGRQNDDPNFPLRYSLIRHWQPVLAAYLTYKIIITGEPFSVLVRRLSDMNATKRDVYAELPNRLARTIKFNDAEWERVIVNPSYYAIC